MKIYTKGGDKGKSSLFGGERVSKNHSRLEAYGQLDEVNSTLGWLAAKTDDAEVKNQLFLIQSRLLTLGSYLATEKKELLDKLPNIPDGMASDLESHIDKMESQLNPLKNFIIPGGSEASAIAHVARTKARSCERSIVKLSGEVELPAIVLEFINRLSDYLFVLARYLNHLNSVSDVDWKPE